MKIAHITEAWAGGISTYVKTLIEHQLQSEEFDEISLIYSSNRTADNLVDVFAADKNIKLYNYESSRNPLNFYKISKNINNLLLDIKPDIVHLHSTFPGVYGRLIKKFPTVYCPHGWSFSQDTSAIKKFIYVRVEKFLARKTDAIANISMHELAVANGFNIRCKLNTVILNGVQDVQSSEHHPSLGLEEDIINVGFIGRLDHKKGFDLIEPFFRNTKLQNIKLYVIGDSERGKATLYPVCKNITYLGWIDNKKIDSYISQLDVIIVPSRYEGFGLVVIEAMRNSKPVIVSNRDALPELVINGFNGYVFNLDDAGVQLDTIFGNVTKEALVKMGINARNVYLSNFMSNRYCNELTALYKKVLGLG